jgi:UDP-N-acetylmuramate dehydrogenase
MQIFQNFSLLNQNTFKIQVRTDFFITIDSIDDYQYIFSENILINKKTLFLGAGSNVLFTQNFAGYVIQSSENAIKIINEDDKFVWIECDSGVNWHNFVKFCVDNNFYGIENLAMIPGSIGAAPVQNIGAYGIEQSAFFDSLIAFDFEKGTFIKLDKSQCNFGYRYSILKSHNMQKHFVTKVTYKLNKQFNPNLKYNELANYFADNTSISAQNVFDAVCEIRKKKLPNPEILPNAGSFFKNPIIDEKKFLQISHLLPPNSYFKLDDGNYKILVAKLIEYAGLKGYRYNNCGIYDKHSLILINYNSAQGKELLNLAEKIINTISEKFNIEIEPEVVII